MYVWLCNGYRDQEIREVAKAAEALLMAAE